MFFKLSFVEFNKTTLLLLFKFSQNIGYSIFLFIILFMASFAKFLFLCIDISLSTDLFFISFESFKVLSKIIESFNITHISLLSLSTFKYFLSTFLFNIL